MGKRRNVKTIIRGKTIKLDPVLGILGTAISNAQNNLFKWFPMQGALQYEYMILAIKLIHFFLSLVRVLVMFFSFSPISFLFAFSSSHCVQFLLATLDLL